MLNKIDNLKINEEFRYIQFYNSYNMLVLFIFSPFLSYVYNIKCN